MTLAAAILVSLAAALGGAAALLFGAPQHAVLRLVGAALGGPFGAALLLYALLALALITVEAFRDISIARRRLRSAVAEAPAADWGMAFAGTAFRGVPARLTAEEPRLAPLSWLRLIRTELWRAYARQLIAAEAVGLALAAAGVALSPLLPAEPGGMSGAVGASGAAGALALFLAAVIAVAWLALDDVFAAAGAEMIDARGPWIGTTPPPTQPALDLHVRTLEAALARVDPAAPAGDTPSSALAGLHADLARIEKLLDRREQDRALADALVAIAASLDRFAAAPAAATGDLRESLQALETRMAELAEAVRPPERRPRSLSDEIDELLDQVSDLAPPDAAARG